MTLRRRLDNLENAIGDGHRSSDSATPLTVEELRRGTELLMNYEGDDPDMLSRRRGLIHLFHKVRDRLLAKGDEAGAAWFVQIVRAAE